MLVPAAVMPKSSEPPGKFYELTYDRDCNISVPEGAAQAGRGDHYSLGFWAGTVVVVVVVVVVILPVAEAVVVVVVVVV